MEQHWKQIQMYHIEQRQHMMEQSQQDHLHHKHDIRLTDGHQQ